MRYFCFICRMAFNFNFFKGSTMSQVQNALHYWMNALQPAEEVEKLKQQKEEEIAQNAVIEGVEDSKEEERDNPPTPALLREPETNSHLYD